MLFAVIATDKPDSLSIRMQNRAAHMEYLKAAGTSIRIAGPLLDGDTPIGALIIFEANTLEDVKKWAAEDPYAKAELFVSVQISPWRFGVGSGLHP